MSNTCFQFKQFTVYHDRCPMKVTTDGVLLGAWADVNNISHVLDVGTGSGLIALMIAQRSAAHIDAVEIDHPAFMQACENAARSPWKDRIDVYHNSFQHFVTVSTGHYDLVISNPPFFKDSLKSPDARKTKAKHVVGLTFDELLNGVSSLLNKNGRFCIILPYAEQENFIELAHIYQLYSYRIACVKTTTKASYSRVLMAFGKTPVIPVDNAELTIHQANGEYSPDYIGITKDFYLNIT